MIVDQVKNSSTPYSVSDHSESGGVFRGGGGGGGGGLLCTSFFLMVGQTPGADKLSGDIFVRNGV